MCSNTHETKNNFVSNGFPIRFDLTLNTSAFDRRSRSQRHLDVAQCFSHHTKPGCHISDTLSLDHSRFFFFQFYKIFFALEPSQERKATLCQGVSNSISAENKVYKQIDKHFRTYNCRYLFSYCSKYNININSNLEMLLWCSWFHINASVQPGMLDNGTS